jgi:hypothetical protein
MINDSILLTSTVGKRRARQRFRGWAQPGVLRRGRLSLFARHSEHTPSIVMAHLAVPILDLVHDRQVGQNRREDGEPWSLCYFLDG